MSRTDGTPPAAASVSRPDFRHVDAWVFDLDNTLYPSECDLFAQVDRRMTAFVAETLTLDPVQARALQKRYYAEHGTTLSGLMKLHDVDPDAFLDYVHDIDLTPVEACDVLRANIARLPGKKFVFTNGSHGHAERVIAKRGLAGLFDDVFDIKAADFTPKPFAAAYERMLDRFTITPARAAMFEDLARNLEHPAKIGFTTVLVRTGKDWSHEPAHARPAALDDATPDHVHHTTDDLAAFLGALAVDA